MQNCLNVSLMKQGPLLECTLHLFDKPYLNIQPIIVLQAICLVCPRIECISAYFLHGSVITRILSNLSFVLGSGILRSNSINANGFLLLVVDEWVHFGVIGQE
jgi:hypothetical protein